MANERMDVLMARKYQAGGEEKTAFSKIGVAFANRDGKGWSLSLDAMPAPEQDQNGRMQFRMVMREPLPPKDEQQRGRSASKPQGFDGGHDDFGGTF